MLTTLMMRSKLSALSVMTAHKSPLVFPGRAIYMRPTSCSQEFNKDGMPKETETVKHFIAQQKENDKHSQDYLMPHPIWLVFSDFIKP